MTNFSKGFKKVLIQEQEFDKLYTFCNDAELVYAKMSKKAIVGFRKRNTKVSSRKQGLGYKIRRNNVKRSVQVRAQ